MKTTTALPEFSRPASSCHHRTLFNSHRYSISAPVDEEVRCYRKGQIVVRDCIFNKLVVQFLKVSISIVVLFKKRCSILYIREISIAKPGNLLGFGKFRKTVYLFHQLLSISVQLLVWEAKVIIINIFASLFIYKIFCIFVL